MDKIQAAIQAAYDEVFEYCLDDSKDSEDMQQVLRYLFFALKTMDYIKEVNQIADRSTNE